MSHIFSTCPKGMLHVTALGSPEHPLPPVPSRHLNSHFASHLFHNHCFFQKNKGQKVLAKQSGLHGALWKAGQALAVSASYGQSKRLGTWDGAGLSPRHCLGSPGLSPTLKDATSYDAVQRVRGHAGLPKRPGSCIS